MAHAGGNEISVSTKRISNGWIVTESVYTKRGGYTSKETFFEDEPKIAVNDQKVSALIRRGIAKPRAR